MQTLNLLAEEIGTIDDTAHVINEFYWFLTVDDIADQWIVKAGETTVFTSDSREAVDAFLYGMALAYKGLPAHLYAKIFYAMAGGDIPTDTDDVAIELIDESDDERLSDLDMTSLEDIEVDYDESIESFFPTSDQGIQDA